MNSNLSFPNQITCIILFHTQHIFSQGTEKSVEGWFQWEIRGRIISTGYFLHRFSFFVAHECNYGSPDHISLIIQILLHTPCFDEFQFNDIWSKLYPISLYAPKPISSFGLHNLFPTVSTLI